MTSLATTTYPQPASHARASTRTADRLTIWTIYCLAIAAVAREVLGQTELLGFGFYTFHVIDPALLLSAFAAGVNLSRNSLNRGALMVPIVVIALLIALNFVRGMSESTAGALLWIRANGGIATILLLGLAMRPTPTVLRAARRALLWIALILSGLEILRLATTPTLFMTFEISAADANDGGRPLAAWGAFLMVLASGMLLSDLLARRRIVLNWLTIYTLALPVLILASGQGTASIAELVTIITVVLTQRGREHGMRILLGILGLTLIGLLVNLALPAMLGSETLTQRSNNLGTRQMAWQSLSALWPQLPAFTQIFGYPAGQLPPIFIFAAGEYRPWEISLHSMYYGSLPMMGYLGLAAYMAFLGIITLQTMMATFSRNSAIPAYPLAFCFATAILSYSYEVRGDALMGVFIAIWWLRAPRTALQGLSTTQRR